MKSRGFRLSILFIAIILLLAALPALADDSTSIRARVARLSLAEGDVQIDRNGGEGWEAAIPNMPVNRGAHLYAAENSRLELELEDGSSVRVAGPSEIALSDLSWTAQGTPVNVLQVFSGTVYVNARLRGGDDFRVEGADGLSFAVAAPSHLRIIADEQVISVAVTSGEVVVGGGQQRLSSGETFNYIPGQPESAVRLGQVAAQPADGWNQQREAYDEQYASQGTPGYGEADLGYYGKWVDVPGYGMMWQPNNAGEDWDPFADGAWSYYPDWGWTFISAYPWGWEPYFYGDWCYVNGSGYWWRKHPVGNPPRSHGGWHPQPVVGGGMGKHIKPPRMPSPTLPHHTYTAVADSVLKVGRIGAAGNGAEGSPMRSNVARPVGKPLPAQGTTQGTAASNPEHPPVVTGEKGHYRLADGVQSGHNGYELNRPSNPNSPVDSTNPPENNAKPPATSNVAHPGGGEVHHAPAAPSAPSGATHTSGTPAAPTGTATHTGGGAPGGGGGHTGGESHPSPPPASTSTTSTTTTTTQHK